MRRPVVVRLVTNEGGGTPRRRRTNGRAKKSPSLVASNALHLPSYSHFKPRVTVELELTQPRYARHNAHRDPHATPHVRTTGGPCCAFRSDEGTERQPASHQTKGMRSAGAALLLLASGAWGFVPAARLAPARAVAARQRAAGALRMDAGEGAAPKLAKIEAIKVSLYLCLSDVRMGGDGGAAAAGGRATMPCVRPCVDSGWPLGQSEGSRG